MQPGILHGTVAICRESQSQCHLHTFQFKVIASQVQTNLHHSAKKGGLGHKTFSRPLDKADNTIERTLDALLSTLGDNSPYVEYWTRQEWRSIEAHADVDEFLAKNQDAAGQNDHTDFRYPTNGHVLYLHVGSSVRGPTCVFPGRRSGRDLLTTADENESPNVDLVIVPAVPGRLLRFEGNYFHAVPRPTDLWLLKFVQGAAQFEPEEEWGRSVILFNTWDDPPLDVPLNAIVEDESCLARTVDLCNPKLEWKEIYNFTEKNGDGGMASSNAQNNDRVSAKIWLLGNLRRRGHEMRTLKLSSPSNLSVALHETSTLTHLLLGPSES